MTYLVRSQGQFENLDQIRDMVVMTRQGVPVYMKDIAEVKDSTEDFRSFTRINGKPGVRLRITSSRPNTVAIADPSAWRSSDQPRIAGDPAGRARRQLDLHQARRSTRCRSRRCSAARWSC